MAFRLVTCPESGHLELIDFEDTPFGLLIRDCSGLRECPRDCPRTCAARLDRRQRLDPWVEAGEVTAHDVLAALQRSRIV
jgi:hypothetical protein